MRTGGLGIAQGGVALALLGFAGGCSVHAVGPVPPGMLEDRYAALQFIAARNLHCPVKQLAYEALGHGRHGFRGCGVATVLLLLDGEDAAAYGFPRGFIEPAPSNHFALEAGCPLRETQEEAIDSHTRLVRGCGKQVTYRNACNGTNDCRTGPKYWHDCLHCEWVPEATPEVRQVSPPR